MTASPTPDETARPTPNSLWLVVVECRHNVIAVNPTGDGFFIPGQEPCWGLDHVTEWISEIDPATIAREKERADRATAALKHADSVAETLNEMYLEMKPRIEAAEARLAALRVHSDELVKRFETVRDLANCLADVRPKDTRCAFSATAPSEFRRVALGAMELHRAFVAAEEGK